MYIEINKKGAFLSGVTHKKVFELIKSANSLDVFKYYGVNEPNQNVWKLHEKIFNHFEVLDHRVNIKPFWAGEICLNGGLEKYEFINFQVLAFELWEEFYRGEHQLKILVNGKEFELNTRQPLKHEIKTTIEMIKQYKRQYRTSRKGCPFYAEAIQKTESGYSQLCCLCGKEKITLLKRRKEND